MSGRCSEIMFFLDETSEIPVSPPSRGYDEDAGLDLRFLSDKGAVIPPHGRLQVPTGVGFDISPGWYGMICNRTSGGKRGLIPLGQVVDSNFTGFLTLTLCNTSNQPLRIESQERVAQIVFMKHCTSTISQTRQSDVRKTDRGSGAFGSTGKF